MSKGYNLHTAEGHCVGEGNYPWLDDDQRTLTLTFATCSCRIIWNFLDVFDLSGELMQQHPKREREREQKKSKNKYPADTVYNSYMQLVLMMVHYAIISATESFFCRQPRDEGGLNIFYWYPNK